MEVPYDEGVASHIGPESCAGNREDAGEALTGERAGQVLSREKGYRPGRRRSQRLRKATRVTSIRRDVSWPCVVGDPEHARKLHAREPGDPTSGLGGWCRGPRCESRGNEAAMNVRGKSDRSIDTVEAPEQSWVGFPAAEGVEERGLAKGNLLDRNKFRTQDRGRGRYGEP